MSKGPVSARPALSELRRLGLARKSYRFYDPLQRVFILLNRFPPLLAFNKGLYRVALWGGLRYVTVPGVESVYLRGSMAAGKLVPGLSDIDLQFLITPLPPAAEGDLQRRFWGRFRRLRKCIPIFCDAFLSTADELKTAIRGGHMFVGSGGSTTLLSGAGCDLDRVSASDRVLAAVALKRMLRNYSKSVSLSFAGMVEGPLRRGYFRLRPGYMQDAERLLGKTPAAVQRLWDERDRLATEGYQPKDIEAAAERIFLESFEILRLLGSSNLRGMPSGEDSAPTRTLWPHPAPPAELDRALKWAEGVHRSLRRRAPGARAQLLLGASPNRDYDFRLYAVIPDSVGREETLETARTVREAYWSNLGQGPWELFTTFRAPLIIPASATRLLPMGYRSPGEHDYLRRHGVCLDGSIDDLDLSCRRDWEELSLQSETAMNCSYLRKRYWENPKDSRKVRAVLHDLLSGITPATRLATEHGVVTTTVAESRAAFRQTYDEEESRSLDAVAQSCLAGEQHQPGNEWMFEFLRTQIDAIYSGLEAGLEESSATPLP